MYLDSSILVKLLVEEPDSDFFDEALAGKALSSSELALAEVRSALLARERAKLLRPGDQRVSWAVLLEKVRRGELRMHPLDFLTIRKSVHVLEHCHPDVPLRTFDAIHVAACDLSQDFPLCTTDARMRAAADRLGIPVFPKEIP